MPKKINHYKSSNKTLSTTPIQTNQSPSIGSSIKDGIASGFGWGIGTSVARSIFGGSTNQSEPQTQIIQTQTKTEKCSNEKNEYFSCLKNNSAGMCYNYEELLKQCIEK